MGTGRDPNEPEEKSHCPVCGYRGLWQPAYQHLPPPPFPDFGDPPYTDRLGAYSHQGCDCCGYEFGYDDDARACGHPTSFRDYRRAWIAEGCLWFSTTRLPPAGWSPEDQLRAAGIRYDGPDRARDAAPET